MTVLNIKDNVLEMVQKFGKHIEFLKRIIHDEELLQEANDIVAEVNNIANSIGTEIPESQLENFLQILFTYSEKLEIYIYDNITKKSEDILNVLNSGVQTYIDDHVTHKVSEEKFDGYVILDNGKVCPVYLHTTCSLNPLYLDNENKLHVSTWSTGNIMHNRGAADLETAVVRYNEQCGEYGNLIIVYKQF